MSGDDDRPGFLDREKKSFSELDRLRRERRGPAEGRSTSPAQRARVEAAKKQYVKSLDGIFSKGKGGAEGERLAEVVRAARGTPELAAACRAYRDAVGPPADAGLISCFLDAGEREIVLAGLDSLRAGREAGRVELGSGLRTQLRMLAQDSDDAIASAAEEVLEGG